MKYATPPAISGKKLITLFKKDGWEIGRRAKHGVTLTKRIGDRTRVTLVPNSTASLPIGTLKAILSPMQTDLGKKGFLRLLNEYCK